MEMYVVSGAHCQMHMSMQHATTPSLAGLYPQAAAKGRNATRAAAKIKQKPRVWLIDPGDMAIAATAAF